MGLSEQTDFQFGKRVRDARNHRHWSQEELAQRLRDKGIDVYASTIAKIESERRKPRPARLAEAAAIADLFDVSVDTLLGRSVASKADLMYTLRALLDAASQAEWQLSAIEQPLRDRIAEVAQFNPGGHAGSISNRCARVAEKIAETRKALRDILDPPEGAGIKRFTRKLLREMLDREESDDET
jgi:transcriptional regulator with XRE-family HTH domain